MENAPQTPETTSQVKEAHQPKRKGIVTSAAGDKTIRVLVESLVKHPQYGKYLLRRSKLAAHDPKNTAQKGDLVEIASCRRISKSKSWRLVQVLKKATITSQAKAERG